MKASSKPSPEWPLAPLEAETAEAEVVEEAIAVGEASPRPFVGVCVNGAVGVEQEVGEGEAKSDTGIVTQTWK